MDKAAAAAASVAGQARINQAASRDQTIGTFHALGKLLHHKRDPEQQLKQKVLGSLEASGPLTEAGGGAAAGPQIAAAAGVAEALEEAEAALQGGAWKSEANGPVLKKAKANSNKRAVADHTSSMGREDRSSSSPSNASPSNSSGRLPVMLDVLPHLCRGPLRFDPEAVLAAGGLDAGSVVGFLSENYLNFTGEEEIEEVALAADYLSIGGECKCGVGRACVSRDWLHASPRWHKAFQENHASTAQLDIHAVRCLTKNPLMQHTTLKNPVGVMLGCCTA